MLKKTTEKRNEIPNNNEKYNNNQKKNVYRIATTAPNIFILLHYLAVQKEILLLDLYINIPNKKRKKNNVGKGVREIKKRRDMSGH